MTKSIKVKPQDPHPTVEIIKELSESDLNDLCDATDAAIENGGGFGWVDLPARDILERYWQGVVTMPSRVLFVARLDGVICGTCQLVFTPNNNQAQAFAAQLSTAFVAPWARGFYLGKRLIEAAEEEALEHDIAVINLDVRETMKEAIQLYESAGYIQIGMHPYYAQVDGEVLKGYHYYKVIDPSAV